MALDAAALRNNTYCLHEISKNVDGEVLVLDADQKTCPNPPCEPLTLVQYLDLTLRRADCDSDIGAILDGVMRVSNLTTVFTGPRRPSVASTRPTFTGNPLQAEASEAARFTESPTPVSSGPQCSGHAKSAARSAS